MGGGHDTAAGPTPAVVSILACSSSSKIPTMSTEHAALIRGDNQGAGGGGGSGRQYHHHHHHHHPRRLCEDRRGFFEHLRPKPLLKSVRCKSRIGSGLDDSSTRNKKIPLHSFSHLLCSLVYMQTIRVAVMQGTQVATQYLNDQLKEDLDRDELVARGKVSRHDADADGNEWAVVREDVCGLAAAVPFEGGCSTHQSEVRKGESAVMDRLHGSFGSLETVAEI
jgi:hypothetical protein